MYTQLISHIKEEITINEALEQKLIEYGKIINLKKNEYILKDGEICQHGYFVNNGCLIQTLLNKNGKEIVMAFYLKYNYPFISSAKSYFTGEPDAFEIKAIEESQVIQYKKEHLEKLAKEYNEFGTFYHKITANALLHVYMFSAMRLSLSADEFLAYLYEEHSYILQHIPDKYIAQFMGVSKEWLSKIKKKVLKG